ncbi:hypothetical protein Wcon_02167 [Wolbachia endosymbiont of Cylisticus convexus]|nr:hypothetical protein Wcon_02167 [Wolbachia endosymbiont of Cylisticus convexus]
MTRKLGSRNFRYKSNPKLMRLRKEWIPASRAGMTRKGHPDDKKGTTENGFVASLFG